MSLISVLCAKKKKRTEKWKEMLKEAIPMTLEGGDIQIATVNLFLPDGCKSLKATAKEPRASPLYL